MNEYHKIKTIFNRNPDTNYKTLLEDQYSIPEFKFLKNNEWIFTEKVDGTNIRVIYKDGAITFKGRTEEAQIPSKLVTSLMELFLPQLNTFKELFEDNEVCLYGEGYGTGIQKGGCYRQDQNFVLFDIKIGKYWLQRRDIENLAASFGIDIVPIIGSGTITDMFIQVANGFNSKWGDFIAEGIVARPATEFLTRSGHRIITKLKYKDFIR